MNLSYSKPKSSTTCLKSSRYGKCLVYSRQYDFLFVVFKNETVSNFLYQHGFSLKIVKYLLKVNASDITSCLVCFYAKCEICCIHSRDKSCSRTIYGRKYILPLPFLFQIVSLTFLLSCNGT